VLAQGGRIGLLLVLKERLQGLLVLPDLLLAGAMRLQHALFEFTKLALLLLGKAQRVGHGRKHEGHYGSAVQRVLHHHALLHHAHHAGHHLHHGHHAHLAHHTALHHSAGGVRTHHGMAVLLGQGRHAQQGQAQHQSFDKGCHGVASSGWLHVQDTHANYRTLRLERLNSG